MRSRMLNVLLVGVGVVLAVIFFASDRSISGFMESCGDLISQALGL